MGFTGPKETGDPDTIGTLVVVIGVQKRFQAFFNLVGEHIFFYFKEKARFIIGFDNPFYRAVNRFVKNSLKSHYASLGSY